MKDEKLSFGEAADRAVKKTKDGFGRIHGFFGGKD